VLENEVLRRISGSKREGVTGEWRNCDPVKEIRWAGHLACMEHSSHKGSRNETTWDP
jgi:hypothetical protein